MTLHAALALSAVVAAAYLFFASPSRVWPGIALLAGGIEVAQSHAWLTLPARGSTVTLVLGAALLVPGLVIWWRAPGKGPLTGSSILAFIGLVQTGLVVLARL
jgi:predicted metal-binding membrane protein